MSRKLLHPLLQLYKLLSVFVGQNHRDTAINILFSLQLIYFQNIFYYNFCLFVSLYFKFWSKVAQIRWMPLAASSCTLEKNSEIQEYWIHFIES